MTFVEANFDRLIGPSHHYGGLSPGNLASTVHRDQVSSPKRAALQGLLKMKRLADRGLLQAVLPPQRRPALGYLRERGWEGSDAEVVRACADQDPFSLSVAYSSSAMWVANAATVSPSIDTSDGRLHLTVANLQSMPHRRLEAEETAALFRRIFSTDRFVVHDPLPGDPDLADEGAANGTRLCVRHGEPGVQLFVYGRDADGAGTSRFEARQTFAASAKVADQHQLPDDRRVFARQNPVAIDAGAFHNDVVAVGNERVHLLHELAYADQSQVLDQLSERVGPDLIQIEVGENELTLEEAVKTYLFNSQLITVENGEMMMLCPAECERSRSARRVLDRILADDNPIATCEFVDLTESMQNGGGPACLRLRVPLSESEQRDLSPSIWLTDQLYDELAQCIRKGYRDELTPGDLGDPELIAESRAVLDEIDAILKV